MKRVLAGEDAPTGAAEADEAANALASLSVTETKGEDTTSPPATSTTNTNESS